MFSANQSRAASPSYKRRRFELNDLIGEAQIFIVAEQLLEQTGMPLGEIAGALHCADLDAFPGAFGGWTGVAPSASPLSMQRNDGQSASVSDWCCWQIGGARAVPPGRDPPAPAPRG